MRTGCEDAAVTTTDRGALDRAAPTLGDRGGGDRRRAIGGRDLAARGWFHDGAGGASMGAAWGWARPERVGIDPT